MEHKINKIFINICDFSALRACGGMPLIVKNVQILHYCYIVRKVKLYYYCFRHSDFLAALYICREQPYPQIVLHRMLLCIKDLLC